MAFIVFSQWKGNERLKKKLTQACSWTIFLRIQSLWKASKQVYWQNRILASILKQIKVNHMELIFPKGFLSPLIFGLWNMILLNWKTWAFDSKIAVFPVSQFYSFWKLFYSKWWLPKPHNSSDWFPHTSVFIPDTTFFLFLNVIMHLRVEDTSCQLLQEKMNKNHKDLQANREHKIQADQNQKKTSLAF